MKIKTPDIDFAAAMMSKGATLSEGRPWEKAGPRFYFNLEGVSDAALHAYRVGEPVFSISAYTTSRRFLLDVIKTEA